MTTPSAASPEPTATAEVDCNQQFTALRDIFIEQIDWEWWGLYRAYLVDTAAAIYSEDVNQSSKTFSCAMQMASDESAAILATGTADSFRAIGAQEETAATPKDCS